jgi:vacuolar-type H+-ATPase catalytic subunit A/Vma1
MNVLIDQYSLFFALDFFKVFKNNRRKESNQSAGENNNLLNNKTDVQEVNKIASNEKIDETTLHKVIIQKIIIEEFFVNFCYHSHKIELKNTKNKEFMDILNLMDLKDLKILFRQYSCYNGIILSDLFNELFSYWNEDIKNNQIINSFLSSISCVKPYKNIMESFFDLYTLPYIYHKNNLGINEGACRAFQRFFINLSTESIYLGEKVGY